MNDVRSFLCCAAQCLVAGWLLSLSGCPSAPAPAPQTATPPVEEPAAVEPVEQESQTTDVAQSTTRPEKSVAANDESSDSSAAIEDLLSAVRTGPPDQTDVLQQIARDGNLHLASQRLLDEVVRISETEQQDRRELSTISEAYRHIGRHGAGEVAGFVELLHADAPPVRLCAANVLGSIGLPAEAAVPDLLETVGDDYPLVVSAAARALWKIDRRTDGLRALVALLVIPDSTVRGDVLDSLKLLGPAALPSAPMVCSIAVVRIEDEDIYWQLADAARQALISMGPDVVPFIVTELEREQSGNPSSLISALGSLGADADAALPVLRKMMRGDNEVLRYVAAREVVSIDRTDQEALQVLREKLTDKFPSTAIRAIGSMGPHALPAEEDLIALLDDERAETRVAAAEALIRISRNPRGVTALLAAAGGTGAEGYSAYEAAAALRAFGRFAIEDYSALVAPLETHAAQLEQGDPFSKTILLMLLETVAEGGTEAVTVVPAVRNVFTMTTDGELKLTTGLPIWRITGEGDEVVDVIDTALQSDDEATTLDGLSAAARLAGDAARLSPALGRFVNDPRDEVRLAAANALLQIDPDDASALDSLLEALNEPDRELQLAAIEVLVPLGVHAAGANQRAVELMQDSDRDISRMAALLVASIGDVTEDSAAAIEEMQDSGDIVRQRTATVAIALTDLERSSQARGRVLDLLENGHLHNRVKVLELLVRVPNRSQWAESAVQRLTQESDDDLRNLAYQFLTSRSSGENQ